MDDLFGDAPAASAEASGGAEDILGGMEANPYAAEASAEATEVSGTDDMFGSAMDGGYGVPAGAEEKEEVEEPKDEDDEPTFLSIWQEQRRQTLEDRGKAEEEAKEKLRDDSRKWIENFNEDRKKKIELAREEHRGKEQSIRDEFNTVFEHGSIWEQVARMVNLSESPVRKGATKEDTERFRQLLIVLKSMKSVGGASASASS